MKSMLFTVLCAALLLAAGCATPAKQGAAAKPAAAVAKPAPAPAATPVPPFPARLGQWLPQLGDEDLGKRQQAQQALQDAVWQAARPGAEAERKAACQAMADQVAKPGLPEVTAVWLLQQLERDGRVEAVPALAAALSDSRPLVRESARRALQANPVEDAGRALRTALAGATDPAWQLALFQAVAARHERLSIPLFVAWVDSANEDMRLTALAGLARTGAPEAVERLAAAMTQGSPRARCLATDAYLLLADNLAAQGLRTSAVVMYRRLLDAPVATRCAAIVGLGRAGGLDELPLLMAMLEDADPQLQGAARQALGLLPAQEATDALVSRLATASPRLKLAVMQALAESRNPKLLSVFLSAARDPDEGVRAVAYGGMARLGDVRAAPVLARELATGTGSARDAARGAVACLGGDTVVAALADTMKSAPPEGRAELAKAIGTRPSRKAVDILLKVADSDPEARVRAEALTGLSKIAAESDLDKLVQMLLATTDEKQRDAIRGTLSAVCRRSPDADRCTKPLVAALAKAQPASKAVLLRALGPMGGKQAMEATRAALKDANPEVQDAAVRALADWPDRSVSADLLGLVKDAPKVVHRVLAMRGYVRVVREATDLGVPDKLSMLVGAMDAAPRDDDKRLVLGALGDLPDPKALEIAQASLANPALAAEGAAAIAKIAESLHWQAPVEADKALTAALACPAAEPVQARLKEVLGTVRRYQDHIHTWLVAGPYTKADAKRADLFDQVFAPEVTPPAEAVAWRLARTGSNPNESWYVDFQELWRGDQRAAYMRTWVRSPKAQTVKLEVGSDDGAKTWLNGKVVASSNVDRAQATAQDTANVELVAGWNQLLIKVTQAGGGWVGAARFRAADGSHLDGLVTMDTPAALDAVAADLQAAGAPAAAAEAAADLVSATGGSSASLKAVLKQLAQMAKDPAVVDRARKTLAEIEASEDYISDWQYVGPFTKDAAKGGELIDIAFPPEQPEAKGVAWKVAPVVAGASKPWIVDLVRLMGGNERVAYLRTAVVSPVNQKVRLEVGSDDGVKAWLNGRQVHANNAVRPLTPGSDTVTVDLRQGSNVLLLKIIQGAGDWSGCARFRSEKGEHLDGLRVELPQ